MRENLDSRAVFIHPIADCDATGSEPVRFGGLPRLPEDMDWPIDRHGCSAHFWAEINLTAIRQVAKPGTLPDFPDGTLFAFMFMYNPAPMEFLFHPGAVDGFSERPPPDTIPPLHDSDDDELWDMNTVSACGRILRPRRAEASVEKKTFTNLNNCPVMLTGFHFPEFCSLYPRLQGTLDPKTKLRSPSIPKYPPYTLPAPAGFPWTWSVVLEVSRELNDMPAASAWVDRATGSANEPMTATEVSKFHQWVGTLAKSDNVDAKMLQRILSNAASGLVDRVWREPFAPASIREHDANRLEYGYPKSTPITMQMFGLPEELQNSARHNADKVLLMQFWAGEEILRWLCQVWLDPEYLREGWFSLAHNTNDCD